jgi:predicted DCC family thiol-disulfide oxidoreductase YuxK
VEKWLLILAAVLFVIGYRIRLTATVSMLLTAHLGTVRHTLTYSGDTEALFIGAMFLLFYALYAESDRLSLDEIRRAVSDSRETLVDRLEGQRTGSYGMAPLKFSLLTFAIIYFGSGVDKLIAGSGVGFASRENMARIMTLYSPTVPQLQALFFEYPILLDFAGWGTLALETGFLLAVLAGVSLAPFAVGLVGFTLTNAAVLGIFFVDSLFFIALFAPYDRLHARLGLGRDVDLVFDDRCRFCMRVLVPFDYIDINDTVSFYGGQSAPESYRDRDDMELSRAMYLVHNGTAYEGYYAFRELLRQYRTFLPVVWLMGLPLVRQVGERVYRYVADNRSRHFTCGAEAD